MVKEQWKLSEDDKEIGRKRNLRCLSGSFLTKRNSNFLVCLHKFHKRAWDHHTSPVTGNKPHPANAKQAKIRTHRVLVGLCFLSFHPKRFESTTFRNPTELRMCKMGIGETEKISSGLRAQKWLPKSSLCPQMQDKWQALPWHSVGQLYFLQTSLLNLAQKSQYLKDRTCFKRTGYIHTIKHYWQLTCLTDPTGSSLKYLKDLQTSTWSFYWSFQSLHWPFSWGNHWNSSQVRSGNMDHRDLSCLRIHSDPI